MNRDTTYIFDFDKTIVSVETLEVMADIALEGNKNKEAILNKVKDITELGMRGKLSFSESLNMRFNLIPITDEIICKTISLLKRSITPSFLKHADFFKTNRDSVYVVSGGFKEYIVPTTTLLGIDPTHIYANTLVRNDMGKVFGYDESNPLSKEGGKVKVVRSLNKNNVVVIGDGFTDYQIKQMGAAKTFIAFTEHIVRKSVCKNADRIMPTFTGVI